MTTTPRSIGDDSLSESWVEIGAGSGRVTPVAVAGLVTANSSPLTTTYPGQLNIGEEYLRLLKEAQRESNPSSSRVSIASSLRGSRCESPKSPPNSPNNELATEDEELKDIFINKEAERSNEWIINYWNVQNQKTSKNEVSVKRTPLSLRRAKYDGKSIFSKEMLYTLFLSNLLSLLLGTGIGLWISKRSSAVVSQ